MSKLAFIELVTLLKYIMINIFLLHFKEITLIKHLDAVIRYHFNV